MKGLVTQHVWDPHIKIYIKNVIYGLYKYTKEYSVLCLKQPQLTM